MGLLDARANAEKITYPVVGEKIKNASNVIDYDIHDEITKDISYEINSNNTTTTGMATIIPGVNAPKLIADTSIIGIPEKEGSFYGEFSARGYTDDIIIVPGTSDVYKSESVSVIDNTLPYEWSTEGGGIIFPMAGGYSVKCWYCTTGGSSFVAHRNVYIGDTIIGSYVGASGNTITYQANAKKGDVLWFDCYIDNSSSSSGSRGMRIEFTITPK